jgi:hypothetical protein
MELKKENMNNLMIGILIAALVITMFNTYQISLVSGKSVVNLGETTNIKESFIPSGMPEIYGKELSVSYDDVTALDRISSDNTIRRLGDIDRSVDLEGAELDRYIEILYNMHDGISCEYCCGVRSIIFISGQPACGCAHSYAMRGLTKYLITEHGDEFTDEEILEEIGKWKTLFFPTQIQAKADVLQENGIELNYINLGSNKFRGVEKGVTGGMVGGC